MFMKITAPEMCHSYDSSAALLFSMLKQGTNERIFSFQSLHIS